MPGLGLFVPEDGDLIHKLVAITRQPQLSVELLEVAKGIGSELTGRLKIDNGETYEQKVKETESRLNDKVGEVQ